MRRIGALLSAAALALSLCIQPALAAETPPVTLDETAQAAAQAALTAGGAQSIQYAVWQDGEVVLTGHAGAYSRSENRALEDRMLYGVGSVSKLYTAAAVLNLAEEGRINLDAPVTDYLPDFTMADERYRDITVRMLLNHASGLPGSTTANAFLLDDPDTVAADTLLGELAGETLKADPGAFSVYCNDGFTLAELVVEAVSAMDFDDYVRQAILEPAGLDNTWFPGEDFDGSLLAKTYLSAEDPRALPSETVGIHGTGGIYASAADLAAFGGQVWCTDAVLTEESRAASLADEYARGLWPEDDEDSVTYGLGWDSVHWYPFAYSGIQAAAKGGDTNGYHAGLVVIPEHGLAAAVLSSGGVSTYNEMAAGRMLLAALAQQGVQVDQTAHTLPAAQRAEMPAELMDCAGWYGDSTSVAQVTVTAEGVLTAGGSPLYYHDDGSFRDENQLVMVRFVEEDNGQVYLWQKAYASVPDLGELPSSAYIYMKLPENAVPPEDQAAWDARSGKLYLPLNLKYTNALYPLGLPAAMLATDPANLPGYMAFDRIVDAGRAEGVAQIPGLYGRDWQNITVTAENGVEFLSLMGARYMEEAAIETLYGGPASRSTIPAGGDARWYRIDEASAGKRMIVQVPEAGGFAVYDAAGVNVAASWAWGDTAAVLPAGGWVVFAGEPGAQFVLHLADAEGA